MQFRPVKLKLQCLRSEYDPDSKRSRQRMVCSVPKLIEPERIPDDVKALLTAEELNELEDYLRNASERRRVASQNSTVRTAPYHLRGLRQALSELTELDAEKAREIWAELDAIEKTMKKLGYKKRESLRATKDLETIMQ